MSNNNNNTTTAIAELRECGFSEATLNGSGGPQIIQFATNKMDKIKGLTKQVEKEQAKITDLKKRENDLFDMQKSNTEIIKHVFYKADEEKRKRQEVDNHNAKHPRFEVVAEIGDKVTDLKGTLSRPCLPEKTGCTVYKIVTTYYIKKDGLDLGQRSAKNIRKE